MNRPDYEGAIDYARSRMARELSPELQYHGLDHTFEHVLPAAMRLAAAYDLPDEDLQLLKVAVAFHDIGWIEQGKDHENISMRIAQEVLVNYGFPTCSIERISDIIRATRPPQRPNSLLEQIMVDADLDVLGREDFWIRNRDLRAELSVNGNRMSDEEWYKNQLQFLEAHRYHTEAARQLRGKGKRANIEELRKRIDQPV